MTTYTLIWTASAVAKHEAGGYDPRHTVRNYPADLTSPWLRDDLARKLRSPWLLIDSEGRVAARS